jgi:hypothetical protein
LPTDVLVGLAQHQQVVFDAGKKVAGTQTGARGAMGLRQTAAMLGKALRAKNLGAYRGLNRAA